MKLKVSENWKKLQEELKKPIDTIEQIKSNTKTKVKKDKYVSIDCEMVGIGNEGVSHALARVSIVNYEGKVLLDEFVRPSQRITDFRTFVSGISPKDLKEAKSFEEVQKTVAELIKGKILVGHALSNDLKVLLLGHPHRDCRDTSKYRPLRKYSKGRVPGLKLLAKEILKIDIQSGSHCSVEDARTAMEIYKSCRIEWESSLKAHNKPKTS